MQLIGSSSFNETSRTTLEYRYLHLAQATNYSSFNRRCDVVSGRLTSLNFSHKLHPHPAWQINLLSSRPLAKVHLSSPSPRLQSSLLPQLILPDASCVLSEFRGHYLIRQRETRAHPQAIHPAVLMDVSKLTGNKTKARPRIHRRRWEIHLEQVVLEWTRDGNE